jgi:hypothetical protein
MRRTTCTPWQLGQAGAVLSENDWIFSNSFPQSWQANS